MKMIIRDIMTEGPVAVSPDCPLSEAEDIFHKMKIRHLPVVSHGRVVGMFSKTDLMRLCFTGPFSDDTSTLNDSFLKGLKVGDVMTNKVISVNPDTTINAAAAILSEYEIHAIPVLKSGRLIGIVSSVDIIRHLLKETAVS